MPIQTFVSVNYCCSQITPSIGIGTRYRSRPKVSVSEVSVNCGIGLTLTFTLPYLTSSMINDVEGTASTWAPCRCVHGRMLYISTFTLSYLTSAMINDVDGTASTWAPCRCVHGQVLYKSTFTLPYLTSSMINVFIVCCFWHVLLPLVLLAAAPLWHTLSLSLSFPLSYMAHCIQYQCC